MERTGLLGVDQMPLVEELVVSELFDGGRTEVSNLDRAGTWVTVLLVAGQESGSCELKSVLYASASCLLNPAPPMLSQNPLLSIDTKLESSSQHQSSSSLPKKTLRLNSPIPLDRSCSTASPSTPSILQVHIPCPIVSNN